MEHRIADIDFNALTAGRTFFPSPAAWEDEALYFLMLDRFSDARENGYRDNSGAIVTTGTTPPFQPSDRGNATSTPADRQQWTEAGNSFVGGTLRGLESKIGYLERLGVTAIWISPVFKQVKSQETAISSTRPGGSTGSCRRSCGSGARTSSSVAAGSSCVRSRETGNTSGCRS